MELNTTVLKITQGVQSVVRREVTMYVNEIKY